MVIDKTTGKGCAWSIAAKTITKELIAEKIVGKPIFRKPHQYDCELLRVVEKWNVCVELECDSKLPEEPLWTPSFIDLEAWTRAVSRFEPFTKLERNVEEYLLPEMDEYLQSIPEVELVSMTRDFLLKKGIINSPICQRAGSTFYFDKNEVYSVDEKSEFFLYEKRSKRLFKIEYETCFNMTVWHKAVSRFEVGMTLVECIKIFLETELIFGASRNLSPVDQLVQRIAPPVFERVPENKNEATFDHIHMTVGLPRYQFDSWQALQDEVQKYQYEICQRVIKKIEKDRQFKRYGIPINFLKVSNIVLLRDFSLEFIFELKELKKDPPPNKEKQKIQRIG